MIREITGEEELLLSCIQKCKKENHRYFAGSPEYPCPQCRIKELEKENEDTLQTIQRAAQNHLSDLMKMGSLEFKIKGLVDGIEKVLKWRGLDGDGISDPLRKELYGLVRKEDLLDGYIPNIEEWDCWTRSYKPGQIVRYRGILHKVIDAGPEQGLRLSCKVGAV